MSTLATYGAARKTGAISPLGTLTNYLVQSVTDGTKKISMEEIEGPFGELNGILKFQARPKLVLKLGVLDAAAPTTDFEEGELCAITGLTAYMVDSAPITKEQGMWIVTASLTYCGLAKN